MPLNTNFCSICAVRPQFKCHVLTSQFDPPILGGWGVRVDLGGRKYYQSKSRHYIPIQLLCTLWAYLAPFGHNTTRRTTDRQTDRARGKGRLRYSIGGPKTTRKDHKLWDLSFGCMCKHCVQFLDARIAGNSNLLKNFHGVANNSSQSQSLLQSCGAVT